MSKRIYQFIDPKASGDDTRWVAASTPDAAQQYARERGWLRVNNLPLAGGPDEIFSGSRDLATRRGWTVTDFKRAGCDVVLP